MEREEGGDNPPPAADFPAKRQLYFGGVRSAPLPEYLRHEEIRPIQNLQMAVVRPTMGPPLPGQQSSPLQPPVIVMPMQTQSQSQSPIPSVRPVKPESPKPRARPNAEIKESTPKKKQCNCKHSKCLKLYCECFASGIYCDGCNCLNCYNNAENEPARREAVEATLERNPNAFRPKIASSPNGAQDVREEALMLAKHNKGCHCKKSGCLKKYCECFQANILCSENCKCVDCKNYEGSEERQSLLHGDHTLNIAYLQQAANAAITGAIGSSGFGSPPISKKRKGQELSFGSNPKDLSFPRVPHYQPANNVKSSAQVSPLSSIPVARADNNAMLGSSKLTYRSLLADIIQPQDFKELCSVLVVFSLEAAKTLTEQKRAMEKQREDQNGTSFASSDQNQSKTQEEPNTDKSLPDDSLNGTLVEKNSPSKSSSDRADVSKARPMSPGTLALMCDEEDSTFMAATFPPEGLSHGCNSSLQLPHGHGLTEIQAEQERVVLTKFRDCLHRLITLGELNKENQCSATRSVPVGTNVLANNGGANNRTETKNQHEHFSNGILKPSLPPKPVISQSILGTFAASNKDQLLKIRSPAKNGDMKSFSQNEKLKR